MREIDRYQDRNGLAMQVFNDLPTVFGVNDLLRHLYGGARESAVMFPYGRMRQA